MVFEWGNAKEKSNRKKHGIDFTAAAKVFLDPGMIEFDEFHRASFDAMPSVWSTGECCSPPIRCGVK